MKAGNCLVRLGIELSSRERRLEVSQILALYCNVVIFYISTFFMQKHTCIAKKMKECMGYKKNVCVLT